MTSFKFALKKENYGHQKLLAHIILKYPGNFSSKPQNSPMQSKRLNKSSNSWRDTKIIAYFAINFYQIHLVNSYWSFNPFVPNAPLVFPLKTSENHTFFWCFQGIEKGWIGNECVKHTLKLCCLKVWQET